MNTVALCISVSSASLATVTVASITAAEPCSVYASVAPPPESTGASASGVTVMLRVLLPVPAPAKSEFASTTLKVTVRLVAAVLFVGSSPLLTKVTLRSTAW